MSEGVRNVPSTALMLAGQEIAALTARAEQAERERDELREHDAVHWATRRTLLAGKEQAERKVAALRESLESAHERLYENDLCLCGEEDYPACDAMALLADPDAGATALLADARLGKVMREVAEWADATFGQSVPTSKAKHLAKEAQELADDPTNAEEMADVAMILGHLAIGLGIDLAAEMERKLAINRQRKWAAPDADGVVEHVR